MNNQTPPIMVLAARFAGMTGTKWSGFADDLFIKDVLPNRTAGAAKDVILNNAASLHNTPAEGRYKQNLRKLEIVPSIRRYGEQIRLTSLVPFGKILGRAKHLGGRYAFNGSNSAEIECRQQATAANWSARQLLVRTIAMESQTADILVPNCECVDHGARRTQQHRQVNLV